MVPAADSAAIMKTVLVLSLLLPGLAAAPLTFAGSVVAPGAKLEKLAGGFAFTEGPTCDKADNVFFVDQPNNRSWNGVGRENCPRSCSRPATPTG